MKILKHIVTGLAFVIFAVACNEGIDPISKVDSGPDATPPVVNIIYPTEGTQIQLPELISSINIQFEVMDDIEIESITVSIDGVEIGSFSTFVDFRRAVEELTFDNVTTGMHSLSITAKDMSGKTTTESVNFEKVAAYTPLYNGETMYLSFDGDYMNLVNFEVATKVGTPGFSDKKVIGSKSYAGATGSYITFPTEGLQGEEFSAVFWLKINAVPDRAGILVMSPVDDVNPDAQNVRTSGFRFLREAAGAMQRFKLNVGTGDADIWFDGVAAADVDPAADEWVHFAFTISATEAKVYIGGEIVKEAAFDGIDWTGCDLLSIMSGAPRFTGWNHKSDLSFMDELRLFNRELSQSEIQDIFVAEGGQSGTYTPIYDGEIFYMPFEETYTEKVTETEPIVVGTPAFDVGKVGKAYVGATDSYLEFPTTGLQGDEFSAVCWMKVNPVPDRAGILVMGPEDLANPDAQNVRTSGFRFFREAAGANQIVKLNAGTGAADSWFDGGAAAQIDPATADWVHYAFTISGTECVVYIDGEIVSQGAFTGIDWTGCDILTIMSGNPRFTGWITIQI